MHRFIPFCLLISLTVGACRQTPVEPESLNFDTDPRILRGTWVGESEDGHSLVLEAKAGLPSQDGYEVSGTFRLDDEVPVEFSGGVRVPVTQTSTALSPQLSPVCGGTFSLFPRTVPGNFVAMLQKVCRHGLKRGSYTKLHKAELSAFP